jgi:plastocyanin
VRRVLTLLCFAVLAFPGLAHAEVQTLTFRSYQPITIAPFGVVQGSDLIPSPQADGYMIGLKATLVDVAGVEEPIQNVMLHHIVFAKVGVKDFTCDTIIDYEGRTQPAIAERFYAEGEERTEIELPKGYGYPNKGSDRWGMLFMLMNHRPVSDTVYVQYTVRYVTGEARTPVRPVWVDVRNCDSDPIFNVPGGGKLFSTFSRSADLVMPEGGRFVAGGAHLHGGGLRLDLTNRSCANRLLYRAEPTWGLPVIRPLMHENGPKHMTTFSSGEGILVRAGDRLRIRATYDNALPHTRVMGIMILYLAPGETAPCAPLPTLPADPLSSPSAPPRVVLPLLRQPTGPVRRNVLSTFLSDFRFGTQRLEMRQGSTFRWTFAGPSRHDVTLASGPEGFASPSRARGSFAFRFTKKGTYRLFCSLHPTQMTQMVTVR